MIVARIVVATALFSFVVIVITSIGSAVFVLSVLPPLLPSRHLFTCWLPCSVLSRHVESLERRVYHHKHLSLCGLVGRPQLRAVSGGSRPFPVQRIHARAIALVHGADQTSETYKPFAMKILIPLDCTPEDVHRLDSPRAGLLPSGARFLHFASSHSFHLHASTRALSFPPIFSCSTPPPTAASRSDCSLRVQVARSSMIPIHGAPLRPPPKMTCDVHFRSRLPYLAPTQGRVLSGGATFACLLMLKHLFLTLAPLYFVYLLRSYCCRASVSASSISKSHAAQQPRAGGWRHDTTQKGQGEEIAFRDGEHATVMSWKRLVSLGSAVLCVFGSAVGPLCVSDGWTTEACLRQLGQLGVRLFPFGR